MSLLGMHTLFEKINMIFKLEKSPSSFSNYVCGKNLGNEEATLINEDLNPYNFNVPKGLMVHGYWNNKRSYDKNDLYQTIVQLLPLYCQTTILMMSRKSWIQDSISLLAK